LVDTLSSIGEVGKTPETGICIFAVLVTGINAKCPGRDPSIESLRRKTLVGVNGKET